MDLQRLFLTLVVAGSASWCAAQSAPGRTYRFVVSDLGHTARSKTLYGALIDLDEQASVVTDPASGVVRFTTRVALDSGDLALHLERYRLGFTDLKQWNPAIDAMEPVPDLDQDAFPRYIDTGDRAADNANYGRAKTRWRAAHPDRYEELTAPSPPTD